MNSTVSVVIPAYNAEKHLKQCLDSVILQTFKDLEIIVINDGSSDRTKEILAQYLNRDNRVQIHSLDKNQGAGFGRNLGLKKAHGKYILFLDADDFFEMNMIEKLYQQAEKTNADITFCGFDCFDENTGKIQKISWDIDQNILPKGEVFSLKNKAGLLNLTPSIVWNQLFRRDFLLKNDLYFKNTQSFNDVYFSKMAWVLAERISYINEKLIYYRINNSSSISFHQSALDAVRGIYALRDFLFKNNLLKKYKKVLLDRALLMMNRSLNRPEPERSLLRSFYLKYLIPKFWGNIQIPTDYPRLLGLDTVTDTFKHFFFHDKQGLFPIVFATNKSQASLVGIAIESIKQKAKSDYFYDIYVLHEDLPSATQFNLSDLSESNIRVTCISVSDKEEHYFKGYSAHPLLYRFLIPELFKGYEKILYLETNIIPQDSFEQIFKVDFKNNAIAGIKKEADEFYLRDIANITSHSFFDSSILLFNIPLCQQMNLMERIATNFSLFEKMKNPADDITNILFQSNVLLLNEQISALFYIYSEKPYKHSFEFSTLNWWKMARQSPFYESLLYCLGKGGIK